MGGNIEVRWNGAKLGEALLRRARPVMAQGLGKGLEQATAHWDRAMQQRFRGYRSVGPHLPGSGIGNRSKRLRLSLGRRVVPGADGGLEGLRAVMFSAGVPYARAQQFGAVIKPKSAKRLAIPGPANLTPAGVTRKSNARAWFEEAKKSGELALVPSRRTPGNTVVLWRKTAKSKWQHWWTLVKQVTLPGPKSTGGPSRLGFYETWAAQRSDRVKLIQHHVQQSLNRAKLTAYVSADSVEIV